MKIKEECLDTLVKNIYGDGHTHMRMLDEAMYPFYFKYYPELFETDSNTPKQNKKN